jgi:DHA2 family multidrug resistance protein-like MFS transporter
MIGLSDPAGFGRQDAIGAGSPPQSRKMAIAAILGAMALVVLDAAIANVALPVLATDLRVTAAASIWVVTAYQLALVIALLPCAALGESIGYRRVFTWGVALFTLASVFCALAPTFTWLVAARFVQGLGGAAVMALGVALFRFIVPHHKLGSVIGWNAVVVALSSALGPTLGAGILTVGTWQCLFAFKIPLGIAVLLATRCLPCPEGTGRRLDLVSVSLTAFALAALVILLVVAGGLALAHLFRREAPKEAPLIPLDLLRGRSFRLAVVASILCFAGQTAGLVALPFYLQHGLGQDVLATGLYMTIWPLTVALAAPVAGRLSNHIAASWLCAIGGTFLAIGLASAALWPLQNDLKPLALFAMFCGLGFGLFNVPNNRTMFLSIPLQRSGAAGGMQSSARLLGQTAGAITMTLLFTLANADMVPRIGLALGAALTLAASAVSILRREPRAH